MTNNNFTEPLNTKSIYWILFGFLILLFGVLFFLYGGFDFLKKPQDKIDLSEKSDELEKAKIAEVVAPSTGKTLAITGVPMESTSQGALTAKSAYNVLLREAQKWRTDAMLVNLKSDQDIALDGRSGKWEGFFISQSDHTKGWSAVLQNEFVFEVQEKEATALILTEPKFAIDSDEAIKSGLGDFGASEVKVLSVRLFQETLSGEWFWAIATDRGNLTLKAR